MHRLFRFLGTSLTFIVTISASAFLSYILMMGLDVFASDLPRVVWSNDARSKVLALQSSMIEGDAQIHVQLDGSIRLEATEFPCPVLSFERLEQYYGSKSATFMGEWIDRSRFNSDLRFCRMVIDLDDPREPGQFPMEIPEEEDFTQF